MLTMTEKKSKPVPPAPKPRKRNAIFVTLDDATFAKLRKFLDRQRVKPTEAAIALTALTEFLNREVPS